MAWLALKDDTYRGALFCIVTGPNFNLAKDLIERIVRLFAIPPPHTAYDVELNGVKIQAFPSNHIDAMRGRANVKFVLQDEADFFRKGEQDNSRDVSERYAGKSEVKIVMVSTPNLPGGLFDRMEHEDPCMYHRIHLPYTVGVGNIYSEQDIQEAKKSPSFEREYNLKYGYGIGNVFLPQQIDACEKISYEPDVWYEGNTSMGIDPAFGSSRFAFVVSRLANSRVEILEAEEHEKADFNDMVGRAMEFIQKHKIEKVFVDGSDPGLIRALKRLVQERIDYENVEHEGSMKIVPVSFVNNSIGEKNSMVSWARQLVSDGELAIHPRFTNLLLQMRSARTNDKGALDKGDVSLDLVDALFLNLRRYHY